MIKTTMKATISMATAAYCALLFSCATSGQDKAYSDDFLKHIHGSGFTLHADSLVLKGPENELIVILIPTILVLNKVYEMVDEHGQRMLVKRVNYTDLEVTITNLKGGTDSGIASLLPAFYNGAEMPGTSEGEFWANSYYFKEPLFGCLEGIAVGNRNVSEEVDRPPYAYAYYTPEKPSDRLIRTHELWKSK